MKGFGCDGMIIDICVWDCFWFYNLKVIVMIIVIGGVGFIGSNIVKVLNDKGIIDILVVDNLKDGIKFVNLVDLNIVDYMDKEDFLI